jgi:SAM-dependent methyltransferase
VEHIDYDGVAEIYDLYASATYDVEFFCGRVGPGVKVLELTSGTGRLSIPLIRAGAELTCVDISRGMLDVLERKLKSQGLAADVLCADVQVLEFDADFDLAILPFQSFMELVGEAKQRGALDSVFRALKPGGRFFCTMHNPAVRRRTVDGVVRGVGAFPYRDGTLVVSGFEVGGEPVVHRCQFLDFYDGAGMLVRKQLQAMEFELIEEPDFRRMAEAAGFRVVAVYGDYQAHAFDADRSPVLICGLEKPGR